MADFLSEGTKFFKNGGATNLANMYKGPGSETLQSIAGKLQGADNGSGSHSDFKAAILANGLQRSNRFAVLMTFPTLISDQISDQRTYIQKIGLMCGNVTVPTKTTNTIEQQAFGTPYKVATGVTSDQLSMSFLVQNDHSEYAIFNYWTNVIHSNASGTVGYYKDYAAPEIRLYPMDTRNNHNYIYIFEECYPTSVSISDYSNETNDTINTITVTFDVRRFAGDNQDIPNPALKPIEPKAQGIIDHIRNAVEFVGAIDSNLSKLESMKNRFKF